MHERNLSTARAFTFLQPTQASLVFKTELKNMVNKITSLQPSLLGLGGKIGHQHVADVAGGLVEVVAHALGADALADDVEIEAVNRHISA